MVQFYQPDKQLQPNCIPEYRRIAAGPQTAIFNQINVT